MLLAFMACCGKKQKPAEEQVVKPSAAPASETTPAPRSGADAGKSAAPPAESKRLITRPEESPSTREAVRLKVLSDYKNNTK